jgi:hypothetical protein
VLQKFWVEEIRKIKNAEAQRCLFSLSDRSWSRTAINAAGDRVRRRRPTKTVRNSVKFFSPFRIFLPLSRRFPFNFFQFQRHNRPCKTKRTIELRRSKALLGTAIPL